MDNSLAWAQEQDRMDELAPFRERFVIADPDLIYLDGNSLGRLPRATECRLATVVSQEWGERLIRGWSEGWFERPAAVGGRIAGLVGAAPDEVIVADSTSVNLFKLLVAALEARPERTRIVTDDLNFPSDLYIMQAAARLTGREVSLIVVPSDGIHGPVPDLLAALDGQTAVLSLSHTVYKSAYTYDMAALTAAAHAVGALTVWDLSHSAGSLPVDLNGAQADLATGCSYKYLNGGPGAPAFLYVRRDLQPLLHNPVAGWIGHRDAFAFAPHYQPADGVQRFLTGTPPILALAALEAGVALLLEAGMARLRAKSVRQTAYLVALYDEWLAPLGFELRSPHDPARRGSHVALGHPRARELTQALIARYGVIPDFREPDNLRLGIAPLYNTFGEIYTALARIRAWASGER